MSTVTVRLCDAGRSQLELETELTRLVKELEQRGLANQVRIKPAFPGENSKWKNTFVLTSPGLSMGFADSLNAFPEVELAYIAPTRGL